MQIFRVDIGERAEIEIPLIGVVRLEFEVRILVLVGLFEHGVFKIVTLAQRAIAMVVVVHPLVDGRGLFADGLEGRVRVQEREPGGQTIVGDSIHPDLSRVVKDVVE